MFAPDLSVPFDKKKTKEFGKDFAIGLEAWHLSQIESPNFPRRRWAENYQYALGTQSYLRTIRPIDNLGSNDSQTLPGADLRNMKLTSTILESIVGKLNKQKFKPTVTMIDALAMDNRDDMKAKLEMAMLLKQQGAQMDQYLQSLGLTPDDVPIDQSEIQIKMDMMPQFIEEMNLELALEQIGHENGLEALMRTIDYDDAICATRCLYINRSNGKRQLEWVDPINSGHSMTMYADGRDIVWSYRIRAVPLEQIKMEAQGQLTDEELKNLRGGQFSLLYNYLYSWIGANNNNYVSTYYNTFTDFCLVMDFEFVSTDTFYQNFKNGRAYAGFLEKKQGKDGDVLTSKVQTLFGGKYICGTGYLYDYGPKEGIRQPIVINERDVMKVNASKVYGSFVWQHSSLIRGESVSVIDRAKPHIDAIEDTFKKFKTYVKEFLPWITRVDQDGLADLAMKEGDDVTAEDLMTTLLEKGLGVVSSSVYKGFHNASVKDSIAILANEGGANLNVLWNLLLSQINLLHDVVGVPKVDTGGGISPEQGKAVTQMLLNGSDNVLSGLMAAKIRIYQNLWENLMYDVLVTGGAGVANGKAFEIPLGNPDDRIPNLRADPVPQENEWMELYAAANQALAAKTITLAQFAYIKVIDNMKQAWAYLVVQDKRGQMQQSAGQAQADEANTQRQMASNAQAQEGKERLEKMKTMGTILSEYAKSAFAVQMDAAGNPIQTQNPQATLQELLLTIEQIYGANTNNGAAGGGEPTASPEQLAASPEQLAV